MIISYVFLPTGAPGTGKKAVAKALAEKMNFKHLSVGSVLSDSSNLDQGMSETIAAALAQGSLVATGILLSILGRVVEANSDAAGFVLDSFPKSMEQIVAFDESVCRICFWYQWFVCVDELDWGHS